MKIKKKEPSVGILGKIINSFSNSKQDTYSCDFINPKIDKIDKIDELGVAKSYALSPLGANLAANSWVKIAQDLTTDVIPAGKYLMIYTATIGAKSGIVSLNPSLDGERLPMHSRQTVPFYNDLTSSAQCCWWVEFPTDSTHTLNIYQYASVTTTSSAVGVLFIRIG